MTANRFGGRPPLKLAIAVALLSAAAVVSCGKKPRRTTVPPPPTVQAPLIDPWKEAALKVEEDRGEPTGREAKVQVPDLLKHYSDRRRFLAVQVAETRNQKLDIPHDFIELIDLIRSGKLVEVEPAGKDYILYGVGANATDEIFSHHDIATGENIPLYAGLKQFKQEYARLEDSAKQIKASVAELRKELRHTSRRNRQRRRELQSQISEISRSLGELNRRLSRLASFYRNAEKYKLIQREYRTLKEFATDFMGESYNLDDPAARQKLKVRLLSFLRPEAHRVLLEIARSYSEKLDRPLPVTSLIRPEQYQRLLGETNPNATRISLPPHSTGLAFDIFYFYMTAGEQEFLMAEVARLKEAGRIEALRELRNHIHVFAFADGEPPDERSIAQSMRFVGSQARARRTARTARKKSRVASRQAVAKSNGKRDQSGTGAR
ncbi:MAG TPA: DUF5715 family protein [Blastocatellia bacterium]|nr:DUF5715 family protein [Blastocatellia bacterium]